LKFPLGGRSEPFLIQNNVKVWWQGQVVLTRVPQLLEFECDPKLSGFYRDAGAPHDVLYDRNSDNVLLSGAGVTQRSADQVFSDVSTELGINPKILLATLEKEQSLVSPSSMTIGMVERMHCAMGCGVTTNMGTTPCQIVGVTDFRGFYRQLRCAAQSFVNRLNDTNWCKDGRNITGIQDVFMRTSDTPSVKHNIGTGDVPVPHSAHRGHDLKGIIWPYL